MNFNKHSNLEGLHAPFSPSQSSWLRYTPDKLVQVYKNLQAKDMGTKLHAWAKETIDLGIKQRKSKQTICAYINDAIGFKMDTEVVLFYSNLFFGTADAISFRDNFLRIHDLKTGATPAKMEQLEIYAALFCLEYGKSPDQIKIELRIYQTDEVLIHEPNPEDIMDIMQTIIEFDKLIDKTQQGVI